MVIKCSFDPEIVEQKKNKHRSERPESYSERAIRVQARVFMEPFLTLPVFSHLMGNLTFALTFLLLSLIEPSYSFSKWKARQVYEVTCIVLVIWKWCAI